METLLRSCAQIATGVGCQGTKQCFPPTENVNESRLLSHADGERDHNNGGERKEFCVWCCFPPALVSKCDMISLIKT